MRSALIATLSGFVLAAAPPNLDHTRIDIPATYRGTWALDPKFCNKKDLGPAIVQIAARKISFYEDTGYLFIAQLNDNTLPPEFFGRFHFVSNLTFHDETVRLNFQQNHLFLTRKADASGQKSRFPWAKCSNAEG